ncbi:MAG TPA: hypothetical protein VGX92_13385 [Pyrinomonadaceae bacterium]|nr:hypothetical protein [Pyrinomonadaceae bacterium]
MLCQNLKRILRVPAIAVKPFIRKGLTMSLESLKAPRFIRKTQLAPTEYRTHFHQIDQEIITAVTSAEADAVTPLMSKIYLRLVNAPACYFEREGVLRFEAEWREGKSVKAWALLCEILGVASATANKALTWMHDQGIIGYFAGKNGVGIRVFLNRAASSIGVRGTAARGQKILNFTHTSPTESPASPNEPALNDSFAVSEVLDTDLNPHAPKNGADKNRGVEKSPDPTPTINHSPGVQSGVSASREACVVGAISVDEIVCRLKRELEPSLHLAARRAAASEHERTREWLENRGLPKAARVAQREAYNVLRKYGVLDESARKSQGHADVGRSSYVAPEPHSLSDEEVNELAQACVALLETQGQAIELTLSEMSTAAGGILLPSDAPKVREKAESLLRLKV